MWLVQATGVPEFQVLFLPTHSGYELLQLLAWLSGLEVPELHHDVSGKQDPSTTCVAVRPRSCRRASSERRRSAIPRCLGTRVFRQISDQKVVVPLRLRSSTLCFARPRGQLLKAESTEQTAWTKKKGNGAQHLACFPFHHRKIQAECRTRTGCQPQSHKMTVSSFASNCPRDSDLIQPQGHLHPSTLQCKDRPCWRGYRD